MEIILLFILLLLFLCVFSRRAIIKKKPRLIMLNSKLVYSDTRDQRSAVETGLLKSQKHMLSGKPDLIYQNRLTKKYMPVELKSGSAKNSASPYPGDLMQLAVYFLLIEEKYDNKPTQGRIIYSDAMFMVRNTKALRKQLFNTIKRMRSMLIKPNIACEPDFLKCRYCMCKGTVCEFNTDE